MKNDENKFRFLIDGFPPDEENLHGWTQVMDGKADVRFVLFFDCSDEVSRFLLPCSAGVSVLSCPVLSGEVRLGFFCILVPGLHQQVPRERKEQREGR